MRNSILYTKRTYLFLNHEFNFICITIVQLSSGGSGGVGGYCGAAAVITKNKLTCYSLYYYRSFLVKIQLPRTLYIYIYI